MAAQFDYKITKAQIALAGRDKATARKLQQELQELQLKLEESTKRMAEAKDEVTDPDIQGLGDMNLVLVQDTLDREDSGAAEKIVNQLRIEEVVRDTDMKDDISEMPKVLIQHVVERQELKLVMDDIHGVDPPDLKILTGDRFWPLSSSGDLFWLGQEGYEGLTMWWLELDHEKRKAMIQKQRRVRRAPRSKRFFESKPRDTCSCGETCLLVEAGEEMEKLYPKEGFTKEEQGAEKRALQFQTEHQNFEFKIQCILKRLEYRAKFYGDYIDMSVEKCLRAIMALAKGKYVWDGPFGPDFRIEGGLDSIYGKYAESLKFYCQLTSRIEQLDVDPRITDYARRLVERADQRRANADHL
jgi:hypothetical protein